MSAAVVLHGGHHHLDPWLRRIVNSLQGSESLEDASDRLRPELAAFVQEVVGDKSFLKRMNSDGDRHCNKRLKRRLWEVEGNFNVDDQRRSKKFCSMETPTSAVPSSNVQTSTCFPSVSVHESGGCFPSSGDCQTLGGMTDVTPESVERAWLSEDSQNATNDSEPFSDVNYCQAVDMTHHQPASESISDPNCPKLQQIRANNQLLARAVRTQHAKIQLLSKSLAVKTNQCNILEDEVRILKEDAKRRKDAFASLQMQVASALQQHGGHVAGGIGGPSDYSGHRWWDGSGGEGGCGESCGFGDFTGPPDVF